jgi:hypothetical protein
MLLRGFERVKRLLFFALVIFVVVAIASAAGTSPAIILHDILTSVWHQFTQLFTGHSKLHVPKPHVKL